MEAGVKSGSVVQQAAEWLTRMSGSVWAVLLINLWVWGWVVWNVAAHYLWGGVSQFDHPWDFPTLLVWAQLYQSSLMPLLAMGQASQQLRDGVKQRHLEDLMESMARSEDQQSHLIDHMERTQADQSVLLQKICVHLGIE